MRRQTATAQLHPHPRPLEPLLEVFLADHGLPPSGAHHGRQQGEARPLAFHTPVSSRSAPTTPSLQARRRRCWRSRLIDLDGPDAPLHANPRLRVQIKGAETATAVAVIDAAILG